MSPSQSENKFPATNNFRKQMSQRDFDDRRAKNLCFFCDQAYSSTHREKCTSRMYALEVIPSEEEVLVNVAYEHVEHSGAGQDGAGHRGARHKGAGHNGAEHSGAGHCDAGYHAQMLQADCPYISLNALSGITAYQ